MLLSPAPKHPCTGSPRGVYAARREGRRGCIQGAASSYHWTMCFVFASERGLMYAGDRSWWTDILVEPLVVSGSRSGLARTETSRHRHIRGKARILPV